MKKALLPFIFFFSQSCFAGYFVEKSLYAPYHIVVGRGTTRALAEKDALAAIPKSTTDLFFEPDSNFNAPALQCANNGSGDGIIVWNEKDECHGVDIQMIIPLRKVSR